MLNDTILSSLTKTYSDKQYRHTAMLRHKGSLIAFAMDNQRRIYYAVLDQSPDNADSPLDVSLWPGGLTELDFPNEIAEVGFGIADQTLLPTYQRGSDTPVKTGVRIDSREKDLFRSTTARLTADAPFQVLTDGRYVYLFRQAIDADHPTQVFKKDKDGETVLDKSGKPVPLVDATLLVDRFVLVGTTLEPRLEVRFQRSRSKTRPASRKDSLGPKDLDGNDFFEPTQELKFIGNLTGGRFTVMLLPTAVAEVERWQIFAQNRATGRIDAFNVERSADGLFNTRGSQVFSPTKEGHAESALQLEKPSDHVALSKGVTLGETFTFEGWIFPEQIQSTQPQVLMAGAKSGANAGGPSILVSAQTRIRVDFGGGQGDKYTSKSILTPNTWNHVAITFDGAAFRFYIGGNLRDKIDLEENAEKPPGKPALFFGAAQNSFKGTLDEIRLWNRARAARELQNDLNQRLTGLEPGLVGYWRFDEAAGDTVFDQTNNGADGTLNGGNWVTSDAPIGEKAGVNRNTFQIVSRKPDDKLESREVASGLTALLYFQQANVPSGYGGEEKPLKQTARVMLAFATKGSSAGVQNYIASLDFGVSPSGKIAQAPDRIPLSIVNPDPTKSSVNEQLDAVKAAEGQVRVLGDSVKKLEKKRDARKTELDDLQAQLDGAKVKIHALNASNAAIVLEKNIGSVTYNELNNLGINDRVTKLELPGPLQITVFMHDVDAGASKTFSEEGTVNLADFDIAGQPAGTKWSNHVSGLTIAVNPAFLEKITKSQQRLSQAQNDLTAQQVLLTDAQAALASLQSVLRTGAEVEMPAVHLDASGLSIAGGLLGFAWTESTPLLFDSATGSLALYFRGADDQFFATYYTTFTEKAKYPLVDKSGNQAVICVARSTDLGMDKIAVEISNGPDDDNCTLKITGLEIEETWTKMPRDPERFARVLNGEAGHYENGKLVGYREFVGSGILESDQLTLEAPGVRRALEKGAALMLGTTRLLVKEAVAKNATTIPVSSQVLIFPTQPLPIYFMEYDYAADASTTKVPGDLFGGSLLLRAVSLANLHSLPNLDSNVANQRVTSGTTLKSKWTAAAPGSALLFNGTDTFARLEGASKLKQFDLDDDVTLEAWVRPLKVEDKSRIIQHKSNESNYTLGLQKKDLNSAFKFDGTADYVTIPKNAALNFAGAITIEAWVKLEASDGSRNIVAHGYPHDDNPELFLRIEDGQYQAGIWSGGNHLAAMPIPEADKQGKDWVHLAGVYDAVSKKWLLYRNGVLGKSTNSNTGALAVEADWGIGANPNPAANVTDRRLWKGEIDDVRVWKRARTQAEILADMNRRLAGNETDLTGYWHFENKQARDYSRNFNDGVLHGEPEQAVSPLPAYAVFAGVNGKLMQSKEVFPAGNWAHFAAVFQQNYGLKFNGISSYLDCGKDESLNIGTDLTIEAFLRPTSFFRGSGIVARDTNTTSNQRTPYSLAFNVQGKLVFSFQDRNGNLQTFTSTASAQLNQSTRVAVTRKRESQTHKISDNETKTLGWYTIELHIGNTSESFIYAFDESTRLAVAELKKSAPNANVIRAGSDRVPDIGRNNANTLIGRNAAGSFAGIISEVRIWNAARDAANLDQEIGGGEEGLVSWWRFEEREGTRANDSNGQNHASLNGSLEWVKDPDPQSSVLTFYCNDRGTLTTENLTGLAAANNQFALGALANAVPTERFNGEIEEVRIWKTPRTREQIEDNLFRRLNGELEDLIAYYTLDAETDTKLSDNALRGNHLKIEGSPNYILSSAPIGDDAPVVRSALAGVRTPFSGFIHATPAVHEYADMQMDSRGELIGVFKRSYGFIQNGNLNLLTGYKVGDLAVEWIGQVQFAPQLIGFIEGAPPVPSENLTHPSVEVIGDLDDYNEASTVEFAQAEETTYTYSASKEQGFGLEVEAALKFGIKSVSSAGGGLGVIAITSMEEANILIGLKAQFEAMWSWSSEASVGTTRTTGKTTSLELRGRYTSPQESEQEPYGWRRFVPENTGLALVQSETADVFALRLKHNNALISFTMRPNPDIPKDWNIIHFPINPQYVKQGVLDGKIGPAPDVDYPNALSYSNDVSYFKPVEAYALKNKIQKDERELETYYSQFNAANKGRKAYFPSETAFELTEYAELKKKMRRNLVNTYVWTADGGLFAETQQTMEVQTETSGGSYEFTGKGGIDLGINFAVAKAAASFELSALFVGQHKLNISKSRESSSSFALNVGLDNVERDLYMRDEDKIVLLDKSDPKRPRPVKHPYKVDAYRFMSFYLEPTSDHFDLFFNKIVDPIWLEQSDDPAAQALREARQEGKKPPCWRIMHRVTYVSRVLPPLDNTAPPSLEKALQTLDIESNYELIKQLEPYVSNRLGSFPEFSDAVRDTIRENLPELQPHTQEVIQYMSLYFGITGNQMPEGEQFGEITLTELAPNQPPLVNAGLDQIIGLDGTSVVADLEAAVIDDRLEKAEAIFATWEKTSGPEGVTFANIHAATTKATFTKRGRYELKLTANDGLLEAEDALTIIVNERPIISAGANIETNALEVQLVGQILDTGLGDPETGVLTVQWLKSGGLGNVVFEQKDALQTKVNFDKPGNYLLQLLVSNGTFDANAEVMVSVAARVNRDIQALYTFEENTGQTVKDASGTGEPLDVQIIDLQKISWLNGALKIKNPTLLLASGPIGRLHDALKIANEITLEAWLKPSDVNVPGLARILTFSSGPGARNFTLAQSGNQYHLHLRTSTTNDNASNKALAGGVVENRLTHLVCTRDASGLTRMFVNGTEVASRTVSGNFSNWKNDFQLALANEIGSGADGDRAWLGELHLVAIYSRALTLGEIEQNFKFGANANLPPVVSAGANAVVNWSDFDWSKASTQKKTIVLNGRVTHDRPTPAGTVQWKQIGGPTSGTIIQNENTAQTTVQVTQKGRYVFRLTAQDGELLSSNETIVIVNVPPNVEIKSGTQKIALVGANTQADLIAELKDSGLGDMGDMNVPTFKWSRTGGPATVQIADSDKPTAKAIFTARGLYNLKLEVSTGALVAEIPFNITVNQMPALNALSLPVITLPTNQLAVNGNLADNGLGNTADTLQILWEKTSGPGTVTFADATKLQTTATFSTGGVYFLRLTAKNPDNPQLSTSLVVKATVNRAPVVDAGFDMVLLKPLSQPFIAVQLDGTVSDDGLPETPGVVALKWTKVSGPGNLTFLQDNTDFVEARFSAKGKYVLRLEADDSVAKSNDDLTVVVNTLPVISPGPNQKVTVQNNDGITLALNGQVSDEGYGDKTPQSIFSTLWAQVSGPTQALITDANKPVASVKLPNQKGIYVFRLTATNDFGTSTGTVNIVVNQPPKVTVQVNDVGQNLKRQLLVNVTDSGLGDPQNDNLTLQWTKVSGPAGQVTFAPNASTSPTTATFPSSGTYRLLLSVGNGSFTLSREETIVV